MPKILQINSCVAMLSTGQLVENLGKILISKGWESYVAYGRTARPSKSKIFRIGNDFDVYMHVLKSRLNDGHGLGSKRATQNLIKEIKNIKPDIIQLHNIHGYYLNYKLFFDYLSESNIPVVWSLHDCWSLTGHCSHFAVVGCEKWQAECNNCPLIHEYPASLIDKSSRNHKLKRKIFTSLKNVTMISASKWLGGVIEKSYLSNYPLRIIANGIDTEMFYPRANSDEVKRKYGLENKFVVMGVGSIWSPEKGLFDYYKLNEVLSDDYQIVLVGMSDKQIKELPKGILGISRTDSVDELAQLYSAADVVTSLSYLEAFGLTPVEGFACGTPAIVYNCTSTPELITPDTGLIVEPGNIEEIYSAIKIIKEKGKLYYSANCRKQAETFYKKEDRFGDYVRLYEQIINQSQK